MGKKRKKDSSRRPNFLRVKLSFDDGFAEQPIYVIKATTSEKDKGVYMLELIEENFDITMRDRKITISKRLKEHEKIEWTRDDDGNIISPFSVRKPKPKNKFK